MGKKMLLFVIAVVVVFTMTNISRSEPGEPVILSDILSSSIEPESELEKDIMINYTNNNMTIEFKDDEGIIGEATLKSHKTYDEVKRIIIGKNKTVVWYEFSDFKDIQINALKGVEFIDMREFIVNDSKEYKELEQPEIIQNPDYLLPTNKSYHFVYLNNGEWIDYNSSDIPKETITIGIQTDLFWGEYLDVVFNVFENKLDRHALFLGVSSGFVTEAPVDDPASGSTTQIDNSADATSDTSPSNAIKITEIGFWQAGTCDDVNSEVGLYSTSGGVPNALLEVERTNSLGTASGWKRVVVDWNISGSTRYWLAVQMDDNAGTCYTDSLGSGGSGYDYNFGHATLPDPYNGGGLSDSNGMLAIYALWEAAPDTTPPTYSDNSTNSTGAGRDVLHSLNWTDETGLATTGGYIFSFDNCTGTLVNDTWTAFSTNPDWSNVTKTINSTEGCTIRWCIYANDTSTATAGGNWNGTSCDSPFSYVTVALDTIGPIWLIGQNGTNSTVAGSDVKHYVNWTDIDSDGAEASISAYIFSFWNGSNTTTDGAENFIDFETFESDYGDYDYDDGDAGCDWLRDQDGTPSGSTGPQPQNSAPGAAGTDWYVFVETSSGQCADGEQAYLWLDKEIDLDTYPDTNVSFYYSMYGANMGTLNVQLNTSGTWTTIWTISGDQGAAPVWTSKNVSLSGYSGQVVVRFEYDRDTVSGFTGDIALDHINVTEEGGVSTVEFINDTAVAFGAATWSNVTKTVNSTVGAIIKWMVYANDSYDNWNVTDPWNYTTTSGVVGDTCDYTSGDWEVDCSENCEIDADTNIAGNDIIFTGSGEVTINADIVADNAVFGDGCRVVFINNKKLIFSS